MPKLISGNEAGHYTPHTEQHLQSFPTRLHIVIKCAKAICPSTCLPHCTAGSCKQDLSFNFTPQFYLLRNVNKVLKGK